MIIYLFSIINKLYLYLTKNNTDRYNGTFFLTRIKKTAGNAIVITNSKVIKSRFFISGEGNEVISSNNLIEKSEIVIKGTNNKLILHSNIKLRGANIIIRGSNNSIEIGRDTTFVGIRIINVGKNNPIVVGENCMFSDHIEIWASDTHSILDQSNVKINPEKPILIGDKVWVGSRVIILKGVTINSGAVIGMGSIVTKDVPGDSITVGSPNKVIKENIRWTKEY